MSQSLFVWYVSRVALYSYAKVEIFIPALHGYGVWFVVDGNGMVASTFSFVHFMARNLFKDEEG
jgi:hypothetical protein